MSLTNSIFFILCRFPHDELVYFSTSNVNIAPWVFSILQNVTSSASLNKHCTQKFKPTTNNGIASIDVIIKIITVLCNESDMTYRNHYSIDYSLNMVK